MSEGRGPPGAASGDAPTPPQGVASPPACTPGCGTGAYLGPGDRVGDLRVPGGGAGQVHSLGTRHLHLPRRGRQAAGCKRERERESREPATRAGVARRQGATGARALPQLRSRSWRPRDMAGALRRRLGCRPVARSRRAASCTPRPGTSLRAGPGESPAGGGSGRRALPGPRWPGRPRPSPSPRPPAPRASVADAAGLRRQQSPRNAPRLRLCKPRYTRDRR